MQRPSVGVLMLNTAFPRFLGDIGNPNSFQCQAHYKIVASASSQSVVTAHGIAAPVANELLEAAIELASMPVDLLLTSCGFLGELQSQINAAVDVPVLASSLELLPLVRALFGTDALIAIMTYDSGRLSRQHLGDAANDGNLYIAGMQNCRTFYTMIDENQHQVDIAAIKEEVLQIAADIKVKNPAAVVLECTNLSPYKLELREILGVPVFDIVDAANWILDSSR